MVQRYPSVVSSTWRPCETVHVLRCVSGEINFNGDLFSEYEYCVTHTLEEVKPYSSHLPMKILFTNL